jgi:hypothetical protein
MRVCGEDQGRGPTSAGEPAFPIAWCFRYAPEEQSGDQRSGVLPLVRSSHACTVTEDGWKPAWRFSPGRFKN